MNTATVPEKKWSSFQNKIFDFVETGKGNGIVQAVAGSGKSSTIEEAYKRCSDAKSKIILAFNKSIADELASRNLNSRTFHSLCYTPVTKYKGVKKLTPAKTWNLIKNFIDKDDIPVYSSAINQLVGLGKQYGVGIIVDNTVNIWQELFDQYGVELDADGGELETLFSYTVDIYAASLADETINFDDLLLYALYEDVKLPKFDWIFVDESQDLNIIQQEIIKKIMKKGTRVIFVGDSSQAIYGFRGADSNSMSNITDKFSCTPLPLSITYRCSKSVTEYAKEYVPEITHRDGADEGIVKDIGSNYLNMLSSDDLIVCRINSALFKMAYQLIQSKIPVMMIGRDIAAGIIQLIKKLDARDVFDLNRKMDALIEHEMENLKNEKTTKYYFAVVQDKVDSIKFLITCLDTTTNFSILSLYNLIDELFRDKVNSVKLSTIHKAKGLESDNVFWLNKDKLNPAPWANAGWEMDQEMNLCYVAATRAKHNLYFIKFASDEQ